MKILIGLLVVSLALVVGCKMMECKKAPAAEKAPVVKVEKAPAVETAPAAEKAPAVKAKKAPKAKVKMKAVESSTIDKIGYDAGSQTLTITFENGETYNYLNVPEKTYKSLMKAKSKGKYFHKNIKNQFETKKAD